MKTTYLAISGFCALATLGLGVVQTFGIAGAPAPTTQAQVTPAPVREPKAELTVAKLEMAAPADEVAPRLLFARGTRDGVVDRYAISDLFDGDTSTFVETRAGDRDVDFIAEFEGGAPRKVVGIEYRHPVTARPDAVATEIDVIVLPESGMEGGGREVKTFTIAAEKGPQLFPIPATRGKGVWIRIAGSNEGQDLMLGDLRLITATP
jgi:hypothetical protein